jgi:hypothetical protein
MQQGRGGVLGAVWQVSGPALNVLNGVLSLSTPRLAIPANALSGGTYVFTLTTAGGAQASVGPCTVWY